MTGLCILYYSNEVGSVITFLSFRSYVSAVVTVTTDVDSDRLCHILVLSLSG